MSGGAISVNQLWNVPILRRKLYFKVITQWYERQREYRKQLIKATGAKIF